MRSHFVKGSPAEDGIHYDIEQCDPKWMDARSHRLWLINRLAPYALIVLMVAAFCIVGLLENA